MIFLVVFLELIDLIDSIELIELIDLIDSIDSIDSIDLIDSIDSIELIDRNYLKSGGLCGLAAVEGVVAEEGVGQGGAELSDDVPVDVGRPFGE